MADLDAVLEQLKEEHERAVSELRQLEKVIAELGKIKASRQRNSSGGKRVTRRLSAAGRERIAAAQRARWAEVRAQSKKTR
jgi:hypothetical protein